MRLGRHDDLIVGSSAFRISTDLLAADVPTIETRVSSKNRTIFRTATQHPSLRPIFKHSQQISKHIEAQHRTILEQVREGRLSSKKQGRGQAVAPDERLNRALKDLANGDFAAAARDLRTAVEQFPDLTEARELMDVVHAANSGVTISDPLQSFKVGAEAFAAGKRREAIDAWKSCLATEPSNRRFQLVVLLSTSRSVARRKRWVQEILAIGSRLLADGRSTDGYSLLLVAQSAEQTPPLVESPVPAAKPAAPQVAATEVVAEPLPPLGPLAAVSPEETNPHARSRPIDEFLTPPPTPKRVATQTQKPPPVAKPSKKTVAPESISAEDIARALAVDDDLPDIIVVDDPLEPAGAKTPTTPESVEPQTAAELSGASPPSTVSSPPAATPPPVDSPPPADVSPPAVEPPPAATPLAATPPPVHSPPPADVSPPADAYTPPVDSSPPTAPLLEDAREASRAESRPQAEGALFDVRDDREAALFEAWEAEVGGQGQKTAAETEQAHRALGRVAAGRLLDLKNLTKLSPKILLAGAGALLLAVVVTALILFRGEKVPTEVLEQAAAYLSAGQYQQAAGAYSAILSSYGEYSPAYLGRGRAQLAAGNLEAGIADLTQAVELDPAAPAVAEELADVLFTHGRFQEAVNNYQKALAAGDISAQAHYRLASSLVQLDRPDEALPQLKSTLEKDASHEEARLTYAKLLNGKGRYAEAEQTLRSAKSRIDSDYFKELGTALLEQEKLDEAEEVVRNYLSDAPDTARPHALLGEIYLRRKQFDPARRELILALRIDPEEPHAQIALGKAWLAIGQTRGDRGDLAKARRILVNAKGVPEGERLLILGQVSLAEGNTGDAVQLLEQALSKGANPLQVRLSLAGAKYAAKDLAGVAEELQRAAAFAPSDPALALSLGLVYSALDDPRRAAEEYLKVIQGIGLTAPPEEENGPVVLPQPYVPLPDGFDLNRTIRSAYRQTLSVSNEEDPTAAELKTLAESTSFVIAGTNKIP